MTRPPPLHDLRGCTPPPGIWVMTACLHDDSSVESAMGSVNSEVLQAGFAERDGSRVAGASKPRLLRRSRGGPMPTRGAGQARPRAPVQAARPPGHKRGGSAEPPTAASGKRTKAAVAKRHARESYEDDPPAAAARSSKPAAAARKRAAKRAAPIQRHQRAHARTATGAAPLSTCAAELCRPVVHAPTVHTGRTGTALGVCSRVVWVRAWPSPGCPTA